MNEGLVSARVRIEGLCVRLGDQEILRNVALDVRGGTTLSVIGVSGSGKSTLLQTIAGLVVPTAGWITLADRRVEKMPPHRRGAVYLNQEPLLFPHLDVFENLVFGLRLRGVGGDEIRSRAEALMAELDLKGLERRAASALSGGQRQRVAFGRALIIRPSLLLLDEPFSSLDARTRTGMQRLFRSVAHQHRITSLFVTHDLKESLSMGDSFAALRGGELVSYPDRAAFCADPATGVAEEAAFWATAGMSSNDPASARRHGDFSC